MHAAPCAPHAIATGTGFTFNAAIRTRRGDDRWIRITAEVEQENGRSVRLFGTKQDITSEKIAQERVHALQQELIHVSRAGAMSAAEEDVRMLEAIVCALIAKVGGAVRLDAADIAAWGNHARLVMKADWRRKQVLLRLDRMR